MEKASHRLFEKRFTGSVCDSVCTQMLCRPKNSFNVERSNHLFVDETQGRLLTSTIVSHKGTASQYGGGRIRSNSRPGFIFREREDGVLVLYFQLARIDQSDDCRGTKIEFAVKNLSLDPYSYDISSFLLTGFFFIKVRTLLYATEGERERRTRSPSMSINCIRSIA